MEEKEKEIDGNICSGGDNDLVDSKGISFPWTKRPVIPTITVPKSVESENYFMEHAERGKCLIFNQRLFEPHTNQTERRGSDIDASSLYTCFKELGFDVERCDNYRVRKIKSTLKQVAEDDHTNRDCFVCCLLSHGDQGILYGSDGKFVTDELFEPFQGDKCVSLAGKPKIFFIQACRGSNLDGGVRVTIQESADSATVCKIPTAADFLIVYSTVSGFYSWRNTSEGSWFIQALCRAIKQNIKSLDLLQITTIVNRIVAYEFESCVPNNPEMHMMKQIPCVSSTLTRKICFPPKF